MPGCAPSLPVIGEIFPQCLHGLDMARNEDAKPSLPRGGVGFRAPSRDKDGRVRLLDGFWDDGEVGDLKIVSLITEGFASRRRSGCRALPRSAPALRR